MFLSCRARIWCVSDDSELSAASFGLTKCYEKHFGVVEEEVSMMLGVSMRLWVRSFMLVLLRAGASCKAQLTQWSEKSSPMCSKELWGNASEL